MEITSVKRLQILSGQYGRELAEKVAKHLGATIADAHIKRFANGEVHCRLGESARGADVFIFQTHDRPVNEAVMEQAILIDAAKRASARRITAVCPFLGYARQDRKSYGREPITAKLVIDILTAAGADRLASVDLHSGQIQGFFNGPFDHLTAVPVLKEYLKQHFGNDLVIVAPDAGRVKVADSYVQKLNADLAIVHKRRSKTKSNTVEAMDVIGDVKGRTCVLIDDMIDTAGTICAAAEQLKKAGAKTIYAMTTHPILSPPALERLEASAIDKVVVTDTLPLDNDRKHPKIEVVSVAPLIADAITAIFQGRSVSELFAGENQL